MFNATFNNSSVSGENHRTTASHWQTLSHTIVSSTPRHTRDSNSQPVITIVKDCSYNRNVSSTTRLRWDFRAQNRSALKSKNRTNINETDNKKRGMRSCAPKELASSVLYITTLRKWQFPVQNPENMERFIRLYRKHVCKQTILVSSFLIVIKIVVNVDIHWFLCRITWYASYAIHLIIESFANVRDILLHSIRWGFFL
jgi:hypothetical protein